MVIMSIGDFKKIDEAIIIESDYPNVEFGTISISKRNYICAIKTENDVIVLDDSEVKYFSVLKTKGISKKAANLIEATVHGVLSTVIPGAGLASALAGNTAAAAAGIAASGSASHAAGGVRDYHNVYIEFLDGKKCIVRCPDRYLKTLKKYCSELKISKSMLDMKLGVENESDSKNVQHESGGSKKHNEKTALCKKCRQEVDLSRNFCPNCGVRIKEKRRHKSKKKWSRAKKIKIFSGAAITIVLLCIYIFYPPSFVIQKRLRRIVDKCSSNESSQECKILQGIYRISFEYCYSYTDIPMISSETSVYGVAVRNSYSKRLSAFDPAEPYPYYGCADRVDDVGSDFTINRSEEHKSIDRFQSLYHFAHAPSYVVFTQYCSVMKNNTDSPLWKNIPGYKIIDDNMKTRIIKYNLKDFVRGKNLCANKNESRNLPTDIARIHDWPMAEYADNATVHHYFKIYDIWNAYYYKDKTCTLSDGGRKYDYRGKCYPGYESDDYPLNGFTDIIRQTMESEYYHSKFITFKKA